MSEIELTDLQRIVAYGLRFKLARHFILTIIDPPGAAEFFKGLGVTSAAERPGDDARASAIGFSYRGLIRLGVSSAALAAFKTLAPAFSEGASPRAARRLGDTGTSAAAFWDPRFRLNRAHALLSVYANESGPLDAWVHEHKNRSGYDALSGWDQPLPGAHILGPEGFRREHFGFRDGISQPRIKGVEPLAKVLENPDFMEVEAGEFLLGHVNEGGQNRWSQLGEGGDFFQNGSFCAFRQMRQDVAGFNNAIEALAAKHGLPEDLVRAKMCGRWPGGERIRPGQEVEPAPAPVSNNFDFSNDAAGEGCPLGSHIRRLNPRADRQIPAKDRFVLRRGIPYETPADNGKEAERGLLGLFFCASLEQQFEFLMSQWIDRPPMASDSRLTAKDPLAGNHEDSATVLPVPRPGQEPAKFSGWRPFVTTRGTLYLFYPSVSALSDIA